MLAGVMAAAAAGIMAAASTTRRVPLPPNNAHITTHGCLLANVTQLPFCNPALGIAARARDLRGRLTQAEKLCLMDRGACAVPRLGLPAYNWGVEDLHGAGIECLVDGARTYCPTIFPTLNILASSMNDTLAQAVGRVIGTEMRAANNAGATRGRHVLPRPGEKNENPPIGVNGWGPNLNIARDPRARCFIACFVSLSLSAHSQLCLPCLSNDVCMCVCQAGDETRKFLAKTAFSPARSGLL
jgi:hypothetical protein